MTDNTGNQSSSCDGEDGNQLKTDQEVIPPVTLSDESPNTKQRNQEFSDLIQQTTQSMQSKLSQLDMPLLVDQESAEKTASDSGESTEKITAVSCHAACAVQPDATMSESSEKVLVDRPPTALLQSADHQSKPMVASPITVMKSLDQKYRKQVISKSMKLVPVSDSGRPVIESTESEKGENSEGSSENIANILEQEEFRTKDGASETICAEDSETTSTTGKEIVEAHEKKGAESNETVTDNKSRGFTMEEVTQGTVEEVQTAAVEMEAENDQVNVTDRSFEQVVSVPVDKHSEGPGGLGTQTVKDNSTNCTTVGVSNIFSDVSCDADSVRVLKRKHVTENYSVKEDVPGTLCEQEVVAKNVENNERNEEIVADIVEEATDECLESAEDIKAEKDMSSEMYFSSLKKEAVDKFENASETTFENESKDKFENVSEQNRDVSDKETEATSLVTSSVNDEVIWKQTENGSERTVAVREETICRQGGSENEKHSTLLKDSHTSDKPAPEFDNSELHEKVHEYDGNKLEENVVANQASGVAWRHDDESVAGFEKAGCNTEESSICEMKTTKKNEGEDIIEKQPDHVDETENAVTEEQGEDDMPMIIDVRSLTDDDQSVHYRNDTPSADVISDKNVDALESERESHKDIPEADIENKERSESFCTGSSEKVNNSIGNSKSAGEDPKESDSSFHKTVEKHDTVVDAPTLSAAVTPSTEVVANTVNNQVQKIIKVPVFKDSSSLSVLTAKRTVPEVQTSFAVRSKKPAVVAIPVSKQTSASGTELLVSKPASVQKIPAGPITVASTSESSVLSWVTEKAGDLHVNATKDLQTKQSDLFQSVTSMSESPSSSGPSPQFVVSQEPSAVSATSTSTNVSSIKESLPVIANTFSIKDMFEPVKQELPDDGTYGVLSGSQLTPVTSTKRSASSSVAAVFHKGRIVCQGNLASSSKTSVPTIVVAKVSTACKVNTARQSEHKVSQEGAGNRGEKIPMSRLAPIRLPVTKQRPVSDEKSVKSSSVIPFVYNIVPSSGSSEAGSQGAQPVTAVLKNVNRASETADKYSSINIFSVGVTKITDLIARKNPVPTFKPTPPPEELKMGDLDVYECYECGDRFNFERSLRIHLGRCSMKIFFKCEKCAKTVTFTNKCQLLSHLRSHLKIHKSQAVPIHIKSDSIEIKTNYDDIVPGQPFEWYKESLAEPFLQKAPGEVVICPVCKAPFKVAESLAHHFAGEKHKHFFCSECPLFFNSSCALKAHETLHEFVTFRQTNFPTVEGFAFLKTLVCPECGKQFSLRNYFRQSIYKYLNDFFMHLKTECFHLSRLPTYQCQKCKDWFHGIQLLNNHLNACLEQYYKCGMCPMALKSLKTLENHCIQKHEADEQTSKTAKIIYRCHVCDTLIDDRSFLVEHIGKHVDVFKMTGETAYHCLQCGLLFSQKRPLSAHYSQHTTVKNQTFCKFCNRDKLTPQVYIGHMFSFHTASHLYLDNQHIVKFCNFCGMVCKGEEVYKGHICLGKKNATVVVGDRPEKGQQPNANVMSIINVGGHSVNVKIYGEIYSNKPSAERNVENDASANSKEKLDKVLMKIIEPVPKNLSPACLHCGKLFKSMGERRNHLNFIRTALQIYICQYCDQTPFMSNTDCASHEICCEARKRMATNLKAKPVVPTSRIIKTPQTTSSKGIKLKKNSESVSDEKDLSGVQLVPKEIGKRKRREAEEVQVFTCDKCSETFTRKSKMEEHEKLEHGLHPCHLCGLMHESQSSLKRHLMVDHEGKRMMFYCGFCKTRKIDKAFSTRVKLERHFRQKHKVKAVDESKIITALPGFESSKETSPADSQKRRMSESSGSESPVKKLKVESEKGFKCAKCLFACDLRSEFREHISQHVTADAYQCYECGLCFAVLPSLRKHLFMVHKIRNFDTYMEENKIQEPAVLEDKDIGIIREPEPQEVSEESSEEDTESNPLECRVCYKIFENDKGLRAHIRTHGMAFIRKTKRRANTLSPDKKRVEAVVSSPENEPERKSLILKIKKIRMEGRDTSEIVSDVTTDKQGKEKMETEIVGKEEESAVL